MTTILRNIINKFRPQDDAPVQSLYLKVTNPLVVGRTVDYVRKLANRSVEFSTFGNDFSDHPLSDNACLRDGDVLRVQARVSDEEFLISLIGRRFHMAELQG